MKKMTKIALASIALLAAVDASAAQANYTETSNTIVFKKAGNGVLDLTKFNTTLGSLTSVKVDLFSNLSTTVKAENLSDSPSKITANIKSTLTLPTLSQSVVASGTYVFNEGVYDSVRDYGGTSGGSYAFPATPFSSSVTYTDNATLAFFSGVGAAHLGLTAATEGTVVGSSGNTSSLILPKFDSYAKVTYTYTTAVPEPETYAMLLAGLGLVGFAARKRKAK